MAHFWYALSLGMQRKNEDALRHIKTAGRLLPHSHMQRLLRFWLAEFSFRLGHYDAADAYAAQSAGYEETPNICLTRARIALACGDDAGARDHVAKAKRFGVPLSRFELVQANLYPAGPDMDRWTTDQRRLWAEAESAP